MRLGKAPKRDDSRNVQLADYIRAARNRHAIPSYVRWQDQLMAGTGPWRWDMLGNDKWGDCVEASALNLIRMWTNLSPNPDVTPSTLDAVAAYRAQTGFSPSDPNSDNGTDMLTSLKWWRKTGYIVRPSRVEPTFRQHTIELFAEIQPRQTDVARLAIAEFGGIYIGADLPMTAQQQLASGKWGLTNSSRGQAAPGSWGGHCMAVVGYDPSHCYVVTWGQVVAMTWGFFTRYVDEAYAVLSPDWVWLDRAPSGFAVNELRADIGTLGATP